MANAAVGLAAHRVQVVGARRRQTFGVRQVHLLVVGERIIDSEAGQDVVELHRVAPRRDELDGRGRVGLEGRIAIAQDRGGSSRGAQRAAGRADRTRRVAGAAIGRVAVLIQLALEEGGAHADGGGELVVEELAAPLERVLVELGDGEAVAAAQDVAIGGVDAFALAATEHVFYRAVILYLAPLRRL